MGSVTPIRVRRDLWVNELRDPQGRRVRAHTAQAHYREDIEQMAQEAEKKAVEPDEDIGDDMDAVAAGGLSWWSPRSSVPPMLQRLRVGFRQAQ